MRVSAKADYALRALIEMAARADDDLGGRPVSAEELGRLQDIPHNFLQAILADLRKAGIVLAQRGQAGGWRLATRAEHEAVLKKYFARKGESRLSLAALETLAIVAYRQPITAPEVSDIRGVNSSAVLRTLLDRRMIRVSGRKNVVGSPFLYRTTREFLIHFGLNDIHDLPRLEEFGDLIGEPINEDLLSAIGGQTELALEAVQSAAADDSRD